MDKSKSISLFIAKLKIAYPNYFKDLSNEQVLEMISLYQEMLSEYNDDILKEVTSEIIKEKRFMPSVAEIIDICNKKKISQRNNIIENMIKDGYFKSPQEIDKVYRWINEGIIPNWLKDDMKKYYQLMLNDNEKRLLES